VPDLTLKGIVWLLVTAAIGILMWAARVRPDQAGSNLAEWARKIGLHRVSTWLRRRAAARWVFCLGVVALVIIGSISMFRLTTLGIPVAGMISSAIAFFAVLAAWLWINNTPEVTQPPPTSHPTEPGTVKPPGILQMALQSHRRRVSPSNGTLLTPILSLGGMTHAQKGCCWSAR
jgi:hypothetical protein